MHEAAFAACTRPHIILERNETRASSLEISINSTENDCVVDNDNEEKKLEN